MENRALAIFHDYGNHWADRWLKPGFRHVFVCVAAKGADEERRWVRVDAMDGLPQVDIVSDTKYDLASFYRAQGYTVVNVRRHYTMPISPLVCANCVGMAKVMLGIRAPWVVSPWQLYRFLTRSAWWTLPGGSVFDPPKPDKPPPAATPPKREDESVKIAGAQQRRAERLRRGRRASILTSGQGLEDELGILSRPEARGGSQLLGGSGSA